MQKGCTNELYFHLLAPWGGGGGHVRVGQVGSGGVVGQSSQEGQVGGDDVGGQVVGCSSGTVVGQD